MDAATVLRPDEIRAYAHLMELRQETLPDPLSRLLDPSFTDQLWEYEHSQTEPLIPGSLHDKQTEALESEDRFRWLFWGNQVGKTTVGAAECALLALGRHPTRQRWDPPLTIWASGLTWELWEQILLPELLTWLPPDRIIDAPNPKRQSSKRTIWIRADNGQVSRIIGKSAEQGSGRYQSARIHHIWLDEEHPESIWNELQPRLLRHGGTATCTMTPLLGMTWVYHRIYEPWKHGETTHHWCSHAGLKDNPSIGEVEIEALKEELRGDPVQLAARIEGHFMRPLGLALRFDPSRDMQVWSDEEITEAVEEKRLAPFGGIDFGFWRFSFTFCAADRAKRAHVLDEIYSQKESLDERALKVHTMLDDYGCPDNTRIWGDAANPQDILEINRAFKKMKSPYRVVPVKAEHKARAASVTRLNNLFYRNALLVRKGIGEGMRWKLGQNAASDGITQMGSRLMYEMNHWRYAEPTSEEKAQRQDPDDNTADGADAIAALRYAIMSWWKGAEVPDVPEKANRNRDEGLEKMLARMAEMKRLEKMRRARGV